MFVVADGDEFGVAQRAAGGPLGKFYFDHDAGFQPDVIIKLSLFVAWGSFNETAVRPLVVTAELLSGVQPVRSTEGVHQSE